MTSVAEAAEILDRLYPGWYRNINVEMLNLRTCTSCILGQATGSYLRAWRNMLASGWSGYSRVFGYNEFVPDWIREIEWRRKEDAIPEWVTVP